MGRRRGHGRRRLYCTEIPEPGEFVASSVSSTVDGDGGGEPVPTSRLRILRDRMWLKETYDEVTTAELVTAIENAGGLAPKTSKFSRKDGSVDYSALLEKLKKRELEMCSGPDDLCDVAMSSFSGMGSVVCEDDELKILSRRLTSAMSGLTARAEMAEQGDDGESSESAAVEVPEELEEVLDPAVYLRDDGTVDWDGALQGGEAVKKFGVGVWSRINGRDPGEPEEGEAHKEGAVVKITETPELKEQRTKLEELRTEVAQLEKEYNALLNKGVDPTSSVGKVEMSRLTPSERQAILRANSALNKKREKISISMINYELERIFKYLESEIESSKGVIPLNDRLAVAEFGLFESQMSSINNLEIGNVDEDVLSVLVDQVIDFKRRLGIDYYVQGVNFDISSIRVWLSKLAETSREGLTFYAKGCRLLYNDLKYSIALFGKALTGVTLKPREVRTLRRTFKDVVTFIPFIVILIIPLTPIGHVLVFGAIQRFFPDFFPSCFTERRQNLLQLFEQSEFQSIEIDENFLQQVNRAI
eukprot:CAMPEP_0118666348 /NCGR_PEP_ID=MMETSP0785-20121206/19162_1 /TAXON_ID=91992 /ORGANISM="Bolidomonas pacifica, Strain CCMP 1866" /LENGTH=530 /DNA_ID=CAMNT_0006560643 /DNA_START=181 /DNA_END=1769 /DNA_ORIENTATION=+